MDTLLDVLGEVKGVGEGDRELELDSSMTIVDEGGLSLVGVAADEARRKEADCESKSTARVAIPKNWTNFSLSRTKRTNSPNIPDHLLFRATSSRREPEHTGLEGN